MQDLLGQISASLNAKHYYLTLIATLTIPDIAGALDAADGMSTGNRYAAWFEKWVHPEFFETMRSALPAHLSGIPMNMAHPLSGADCYRFRCSLLHQGTTQHPKSKYSRIIFVEPGATKSVIHYTKMNDVLTIDLPLFCEEVLRGASKWLAASSGTEPFEGNLKKFVQRYPNGLSPYIRGVPVIA
jgi:hypothetical protein